MQRVRVGLTGLAFVFLLVMLATAFLGRQREPQGNAAAVNRAEPNEPLAELGVAPGNPESGPVASTPAPAPAKH